MRLPGLSFPIRVAVGYALLATLWIFFSDTLLSLIVPDRLLLTSLQSVKGSLFVVLTALLLYLALAREFRRREQVEASLRRANRALRMLTDCNQALVRATDEAALLQTVCKTIVQAGGYGMAWVGFVEQGEEYRVQPVAHSDDRNGALDAAQVSWADSLAVQEPIGTAIRTCRPVVHVGNTHDPVAHPSPVAPEHGYAAVIALPLTVGTKTLGTLNIYAHTGDAFDAEEVALLTELAADLSYGIAALHTKAAHVMTEQSLEVTSGTLHALVEASPVAIIALDPSGVVQLWNPAAEFIFGWRARDVLGQPVPMVPDEQREGSAALFARVLAGEKLNSVAVQRRRRDGMVMDMLLSAAPLHDAFGNVTSVMGVLVDITDRTRAEAALVERELQLQTLSQRLLEAQEAERQRIARELHDEIGQALTVIKLGVQGAQRADNLTVVGGLLAECVHTIDGAIQQVRSLSLDLRPSMLDDLGLVAALRWFLDRQAHWAGFTVSFQIERLDGRLPPMVETTCFRVVQEALTNVARHAKARHVDVVLIRHDHQLDLSIRDDGVGFVLHAAQEWATPAQEQATQRQGLGLLGMQERVALVGGQFSINSSPDQGTQVRVSLPV